MYYAKLFAHEHVTFSRHCVLTPSRAFHFYPFRKYPKFPIVRFRAPQYDMFSGQQRIDSAYPELGLVWSRHNPLPSPVLDGQKITVSESAEKCACLVTRTLSAMGGTFLSPSTSNGVCTLSPTDGTKNQQSLQGF